MFAYFSQKTLSSQLSQRYRNSRRPSRKVTDQKLCHQCEVSVDATNTPALQNSSAENERYEENVQALKKLMQGKAAPAQVVQTLLDTTRPLRKVYLERADISIRDILDVYPVLRIPKWVRFNLCVCVCVCVCVRELVVIMYMYAYVCCWWVYEYYTCTCTH